MRRRRKRSKRNIFYILSFDL